METIISPSTFTPPLNPKPYSLPKPPKLLLLSKSFTCALFISPPSSSSPEKTWISHLHHGLAAAALSIAINFCPVHSFDLPAAASEFDVLSKGPPPEYILDDAGILSRVTKLDPKGLLSDLESRKNLHTNVITVRKLTSKADTFEYADQVLEKWYPPIEEGNNKGIVVLVTTQKEVAITGGT